MKLEGDRAEWNSLDAECMGSQGLTAGCSAVGSTEWQVLLFHTVPIVFINSLRLLYAPFYP